MEEDVKDAIAEASAMGSTAWLLVCAALVLLMTPGLAFFYGGMVRPKSVLNMLMMSFGAIGLIGVLWVIYGYSTAFGNDVGGGLVGNPFEYLGITGTYADAFTGTGFVAFQGMFAVITVALISGALADRVRFGAWLVFAGLWATIVYFPVAHWVFAFDNDDTGVVGGWIANDLGALDFAGGTAVHINAGAAALAVVLVIGKRVGWPKDPMRPHNLPFVMLGAALLWFGWFGFNAGSALFPNATAGVAFINTFSATAAAMLAWLLVERLRDGKPTSLGAASGIVAGLVAITPACAFVDTWGSLAIGVIAGALCALAVGLKYKLGFDDSLDVVGVHLVGGLIGTLMIGLVATTGVNEAGADGLFYGGGLEQLGKQAIAAVAVMAYSFVVAGILAYVIHKTMGFRVESDTEVSGIDEAEHAEVGYELGVTRGGRSGVSAGPSAAGKKLEGSKA
ncbi:MAG: ammonium transporter [Thermocrispum sp.]